MKCPEDGQPLKADEAEAHTGYGCASYENQLPKVTFNPLNSLKNLIQKIF